MPLPVIPGVLRISVAGQCLGGGRWSNTWHARNDSLIDWTQGGIESFHDIFKQLYSGPAQGAGASIMAHTSIGTTIDDWAYTPLDGSSGAFHESESHAGGSANPSLPAQNSCVVTIRTAARGRQNRGRVYLPPFAAQYVEDDGQLYPTTSTNILIQLAAVHAAIITGGAHLGVGSYGPYTAGGTPHFTPATSFTMDNLFDVQRRRKA